MDKPLILRTAAFACKGGWALDTQFIAQMGDAFLLAHGLGRPVADAVHHIDVPAGRYRIFAYTRDWAPPHGPGAFQVIANGIPGATLGTGGDGAWAWHEAGEFDFPGGQTEIRLHDLTGFEGRCAAIALLSLGESQSAVCSLQFAAINTRDRNPSCNLQPANCKPQSANFSFVVVGGGYAGMCAAVAAARAGIKTALVQDRPVFGGNASSEVRVGPIGKLGLGPFPRNSDLAYELAEVTYAGCKDYSGGLRHPPDDAKIAAWLAAEKNLTLFPLARATGCKTENGAIRSIDVFMIESGETIRLEAKHFADCTGDATLAEAAGAEIRTAPEPGETIDGGYGSTNFWTTRRTAAPVPFPSCPWALDVNETNWQIPPPRFPVEGNFPYAAGWNWETFDPDPVANGEAVRDRNFRAAYGMWDYLKNKSPGRENFACAEMDYMSFILGKRAARRIAGDYILTERDLREHIVYPDGVVATTWFLDLHKPHPENARHFGRDAFRSIAYDDPSLHRAAVEIEPCPIPLRCLYSKDVSNLWMAGKDISATHVAMSSVRVENTTAMMGTVVGRAVAFALKLDATPREIASTHFAGLAAILKNPGPATKLAKRGRRRYQNRIGLKNEIKYHLRPLWHFVKRMMGK